jgi:hypothetical protein
MAFKIMWGSYEYESTHALGSMAPFVKPSYTDGISHSLERSRDLLPSFLSRHLGKPPETRKGFPPKPYK